MKPWEIANPDSDVMETWGKVESPHNLVLRSSPKVIRTEESLEMKSMLNSAKEEDAQKRMLRSNLGGNLEVTENEKN